jgi:hypothetical protein
MRSWSGIVPKAISADSISIQFWGSQDFDDDLKFNLRITHGTPPQAGRFEAHFKLFNNEPSEQVVVFQLVSSKNGWRIDDIIYPHLNNELLKAVLTALP